MLPCLTIHRGVIRPNSRPHPSAATALRQRPAPRVIRAAAAAAPTPANDPADADAELWDRALLLRRALALAADEEDYSRAARVKEELFSVVSKLSSGRKDLYVHLEALRDPTATLAARRAALAAAAACADAAALPEVIAAATRYPELRRDAERAAAAIRHRSVPLEAAELCRRGAGLLVALTAAERADGRGNGPEQRRLGEAAAATYNEALKIDPNCAAAAAGKGAALYWLRRYDEAAESLEDAVALDPWNFNASRMLALARGQLKEFQGARAALAAAEALNPALREDAALVGTLRVLDRWEADAGAWRARYQAARSEVTAAEERRDALEAALRLKGRSETAQQALYPIREKFALVSEFRDREAIAAQNMQGFVRAFASPHGFVPYQRPVDTSGHETATSREGGPAQGPGSTHPSSNTDQSIEDHAPGRIAGDRDATAKCPRNPSCVKPSGHMGRCLVRQEQQEYYVQEVDDMEEEDDDEEVTEDELAAAEALAANAAGFPPQRTAPPPPQQQHQQCPRDPRCLNLPGHRGRCRLHPHNPPASSLANPGPCLRNPHCVKLRGHKGMCRLVMQGAAVAVAPPAMVAVPLHVAQQAAARPEQPVARRRGRPPGSVAANGGAQQRREKRGLSGAAQKTKKGAKRPRARAQSIESEYEFEYDDEETEEERDIESELEEEDEEQEVPRRVTVPAPTAAPAANAAAKPRSPVVRHRNQQDLSPTMRWVDKRPRRAAAAGVAAVAAAEVAAAVPEVPRELSAEFDAIAGRHGASKGRRPDAREVPKATGRQPMAQRAPVDRGHAGAAAAVDKAPAQRAPAPLHQQQQRRDQKQQQKQKKFKQQQSAPAAPAAAPAAPSTLEHECLQLESALAVAGVASYDRVTFLLRFTALAPEIRAAQSAVLRGALAAGNSAAVVVAVRELCLAPGGSNA